jgi:hypothetical protein
MAFEDTILLKIKRRFTKDEEVKLLVDKVKSLEFRIGELTSENTELWDRLDGHTPEVKKTAKQWKKDEYVKQLIGIVKRCRKVKLEATKDAKVWRDKYLSLLSKQATP